jgi:putative membrane protein
MLDLGLAFSHHLLIFGLFGILMSEIILLGSGLDGGAVRRLGKIDLWYGILAGLILAVGMIRAIYAAKGWDYYSTNIYFWGKIVVFALIGILSIWPTVRFIRWSQSLKKTGALPSASEAAGVRTILWVEVGLFALLPLFAAAMARGYGQSL